MSIGLTGSIAVSAAGTQSSQNSSEVNRAKQDVNNQQRQVQNERSAADAAVIAQTDGQSHETHDRDADGRRAWELPANPEHPAGVEEETPAGEHRVKDPTGVSGNELDLSG